MDIRFTAVDLDLVGGLSRVGLISGSFRTLRFVNCFNLRHETVQVSETMLKTF